MSTISGINPGCRGIYNMFCKMFPQYVDLIKSYGMFDRHTIKLDTYESKSFIFSFTNDQNWSFQTHKNFIESSNKIRGINI